MARPTRYKPEYNDKVIEFGKAGMSKAEIAAELGVVYELRKNDGVAFYIGSTIHPKKREREYRSGRSHGNLKLGEALKGGFEFVVVYEGPGFRDEEMSRISETNGLVNIIDGPKSYFGRSSGKTGFGWFVREYRNRFGDTPFLREIRREYKALTAVKKRVANDSLVHLKSSRVA